MTEAEPYTFQPGDRVRLVPHPNWKQPMRGWADRGRLATVLNVFTPYPSNRTQARVRFDGARRTGMAGDDFFAVSDLVLVERADGETMT